MLPPTPPPPHVGGRSLVGLMSRRSVVTKAASPKDHVGSVCDEFPLRRYILTCRHRVALLLRAYTFTSLSQLLSSQPKVKGEKEFKLNSIWDKRGSDRAQGIDVSERRRFEVLQTHQAAASAGSQSLFSICDHMESLLLVKRFNGQT